MKKNIHPKYQKVLFVDSATGHRFVIGSTLQSKEKETFEGVEYPMYRLSVSSSSHPFFTGSKALVDAEGRVDKFKKRYGSATSQPGMHAMEDKPAQEQQVHAKEAPKPAAAKPAAKSAAKAAAKPAAAAAAKPGAKGAAGKPDDKGAKASKPAAKGKK